VNGLQILYSVLKVFRLILQLYETNSEMEDILRIVGRTGSNLGGMSGATATESSIAEGSRMSTPVIERR
jgi:hypothetical protein